MTDLFDWLNNPAVEAPPVRGPYDYAFRYMGSDGLDATITSKTLRMNAWSNMNDPREAQRWEPTGTLTAIAPYTDAEMRQRLDDVLRRSARLLALTLDGDRTPDAERDSLFHRGWAKAPMWANYSGSHQGVCLVLDFAAAGEALDEGVPVKTGRYRNWGRIKYIDRPIRIDITGAFADQAALDEELYTFLEGRYKMSDLHMTKNTGWAYETELRLTVVDRDLENHEFDTPVYLPLGKCIAAVIFGDAYTDPAGTATNIRTALSPDGPEFFQCRWAGGAPRLEQL